MADSPRLDEALPRDGVHASAAPPAEHASWLVQAWERSARGLHVLGGAWSAILDWLAAVLLGALARPGPARSGGLGRLDLELRLLLTLGYVVTIPLFVGASVAIAVSGCSTCWYAYLDDLYFVVPLLGAWCVLARLRASGRGPQAAFGRAAGYSSASLVASAIGGVVWDLNARLALSPRYPSPADVGFFGSLLLFSIGIFFLYAALDATFAQELGGLGPLCASTGIITVSLQFFARGSTQPPSDAVTLALDLLYPLVGTCNVYLLGALVVGAKFRAAGRALRIALVCLAAGALLDFVASLALSVASAIDPRLPETAAVVNNSKLVTMATTTALYFSALGVLFLPLDQSACDDPTTAAG